VFTIFIACLGLFGLSLHTSIERTKEIGIRKVLGADVFEILGLLFKEISKTLLLAIILAIPISIYLSNRWLDNFAYRTDLKWWIYACGATLILLIALATISSHAFKAAMMNPVDSLKSE
jgi:putative ABC transport system permease protein